jgi:hypothetical protein
MGKNPYIIVLNKDNLVEEINIDKTNWSKYMHVDKKFKHN